MSWLTRLFGRTGEAQPATGAPIGAAGPEASSPALTPGAPATARAGSLPDDTTLTQPPGGGTSDQPVGDAPIAPLVPNRDDEVVVGFTANAEGRHYGAQPEASGPRPSLEDYAPVHPSEQESATDQLAEAFEGSVPAPPKPDFGDEEPDFVLAPPPGVVPPPLAPENPLAAADTGQGNAGGFENAWPNKWYAPEFDSDQGSAVPPMRAPDVELDTGTADATGTKYTLFMEDGTPVRDTSNVEFKSAPSAQHKAEPGIEADSQPKSTPDTPGEGDARWTGPTLTGEPAETAPSPVGQWQFEAAWPSKVEGPAADLEGASGDISDTKWTGPTLTATEPGSAEAYDFPGEYAQRFDGIDKGMPAENTEPDDPPLDPEAEYPNVSFHIPEPAAPAAGGGSAIGEGVGSWAADTGEAQTAAAAGSEGARTIGQFREASGLDSEGTVVEHRTGGPIAQPLASTGGADAEKLDAARTSAPSSSSEQDAEPSTLVDLKPDDSLAGLVNPPPTDTDLGDLEPGEYLDDAEI